MAVCYKFSKQINDLIDDEISPTELQNLQAHLAGCSKCRQYLERSKQLKESFSALPHYKTSGTFDIVLREKLRNELKQEKLLKFSLPLNMSIFTNYRKPAFAAALVVVVVSGFMISRALMYNNNQAPAGFAEKEQVSVQSNMVSTAKSGNQVNTQPYLKMKNYVNVREQFSNSPGYIRMTNADRHSRSIENVDPGYDSVRVLPQSTPQAPLIRQANTTVHF